MNVRERVKRLVARKTNRTVNELVVRDQDGEVIELIEINAWPSDERESLKRYYRKRGCKVTAERLVLPVTGRPYLLDESSEVKQAANQILIDLKAKYDNDPEGHKQAKKRVREQMGEFELNFKLYTPIVYAKFLEVVSKELYES